MRLVMSLMCVLLVGSAGCASEAPQRPASNVPRAIPTPADCATRTLPGPFDRGCAAAALGARNPSRCSSTAHGESHVSTTFAPSGDVVDVTVDRPGGADPDVVACLVHTFRSAHVPPFTSGPITVGKMVRW